MIKTINKSKYLQLVGLLSMAEYTQKRLYDIERSIYEVLEVTEKDKDTSGVGNPEHIGDAIWSDYSADDLISKLGLVRDEVQA